MKFQFEGEIDTIGEKMLPIGSNRGKISPASSGTEPRRFQNYETFYFSQIAQDHDRFAVLPQKSEFFWIFDVNRRMTASFKLVLTDAK